MEPPRRTQAQDRLAERLHGHSRDVGESYLGALHALRQKAYPDKFVHFAQSLREVIDQLARANRCPECEKPHGENRRKCLQRTFDPTGEKWYLEPVLDALEGAYARLSEAAHHRQKIDRQARDVLSEVEAALDHLTSSPHAISEEIAGILKEPPSLCSAKRLVALQMCPVAQSQLIEEMGDRWLPYMRKAGFFENRPAEGQKPWHGGRWAPAVYLQKCTKAFGREVADIILSCKLHDEQRNPAVYRDLLRCAARLAVEDMEKVAEKALGEKWDGPIGQRWLGPEYVGVAERLYRGGRYRVSVLMLRRALRLELSEFRLGAPGAGGTGIFRLAAPIGDHGWKESLAKIPALARKSPLPLVELLDCLLRESVELGSRAYGLYGLRDDEMCWPPRSAPGGAATPCSALLGRLAYCVFHAVRSGEGGGAMKVLYRGDLITYRRLELCAYAEFHDEFKREAALSALLYFGCPRVHREYCRLLEAAFPALPDWARQEILGRIEAGYEPGVFESKKRRYGEAGAKSAEKRWKLSYLEPIKGHLDPARKRAYERLREETGEPERPGGGLRVAGFGEAPEAALLEGKGPDEVFEIVEKYEPPEPFAFQKGAAEEFGAYVRDNPLECSRMAPRLGSAHPRIQYELFSGLCEAVDKGERVDWDGILSLVRAVLQSYEENPAPQGPPDLTRAPGPPAGAYDPLPPLFSLVEKGFKRDSVDFGLRGKARGVVEELARVGDADEEPEYPRKKRSLYMSLDGLNGMSFHIVYRYAAWCRKHGEKAMAPEARRIFEDYLNGRRHTASRHAVLGVFLPDFYDMEQGWARRLPERCSSKKARIAFWDGYVSGERVHRRVFEDLWKRYDEFTNKEIVRDLHVEPIHESTIHHVVLAYFHDWPNAARIVETSLEKRCDGVLERYVEQIGLVIKGKDACPKSKEKLAYLWKHDAFKKCDLGMWFINTPLDRETSIGLYRDHVKQYGGKIRMAYDPVDRLAEYAEEFPSDVAECLEALVLKYEYDAVPGGFDCLVERLSRSADPGARAACKNITETSVHEKQDRDPRKG